MTPQDIQNIHDLLADRVQPRSAREGAAILALGQKLVQHFAREFAPKPAAADTNGAASAPANAEAPQP